jgi:hypothetical protein
MALEQAGFDFGDLSGAQLIQKLNGVLASESSKSFSTSPTQFEFKTFLANNPGLALDEKGNVRMLGILRRTPSARPISANSPGKIRTTGRSGMMLSRITTRRTRSKTRRRARCFRTIRLLRRGTCSGATAAKAGGTFSSPDVHAAIAAGKLKKGDTFTDANGKVRVARNG